MTITIEERDQLHQRLKQVLGPKEAAIIMEYLPPVGWADVATKRDLDQMAERLELKFEAALYRELRMQTFAVLGGGSVLAGLFATLAQVF